MTSSYHGHVDVVRVLLEKEANVHTVDLQQSTALGYAFGGKLQFILALVLALIRLTLR